MAKLKETSYTTLVLEALTAADDFVSKEQLREATKLKPKDVSCSLIYLRKVQAVDCVVEPDGKSWWFALPRSGDKRSHVVDEHVPCGKRKVRAWYCPCGEVFKRHGKLIEHQATKGHLHFKTLDDMAEAK